VPHPIKGGEWLSIGRYDKHWPAANWAWCQMREGIPRAKALSDAAAKFNVKEESLVEWFQRSRQRGPIASIDDCED
jgi:hypothetical protein